MPKRPLRPLPGTVVESNEFSTTTVVRCVEQLDKLVIHTRTTFNRNVYLRQAYYKANPDMVPCDRSSRVIHAKMLCVNGPRVGEMHVPDDVRAESYHQYNRSWGSSGAVRVGEPPKCVLVHLP